MKRSSGSGLLLRHHLFVWPAFALIVALGTWRSLVGQQTSRRAFGVYLAAMIVGCTGPSKSDDADLFHPAEDKAHIDAFVDRQAGSNTRQDATMYSAHFTGPCLNSLGKAKLDLLLSKYTS